MYGEHGKIGLIVPSANTVMEPEFYKMAPTGIATFATRMFLEEVKVETLAKMAEEVDRAVRELSTAQVDVVVFGCTSGSLLKGPEWDKQIISRMEKAGQIPSITTSGSVVKALKWIGARRIAVATPYLDELNIRVKEFLEQYGFEIIDTKGLGLSKGIEMGNQYPETAYDLAKRVYRPGTDTVFISCTDFRTIEIIERLERELRVNVVTSNQASFWCALKTMKYSEPIKGYGKLLSAVR
jgi:maleate isomerase